MKTLTLMSLALSLAAVAAPKQADQKQLHLWSALFTTQVLRAPEVKAFRELTEYTEAVHFEGDAQEHHLTIVGSVLIGGDVACGSIALDVQGRWVNKPSFIAPGYTEYTVRLLETDPLASYCNDSVKKRLGSIPLVREDVKTPNLAGLENVFNHIFDSKVLESSEAQDFAQKVPGVSAFSSDINAKSLRIELSGVNTNGSDIATGHTSLVIEGETYKGQGMWGPQNFWKYSIKQK